MKNTVEEHIFELFEGREAARRRKLLGDRKADEANETKAQLQDDSNIDADSAVRLETSSMGGGEKVTSEDILYCLQKVSHNA